MFIISMLLWTRLTWSSCGKMNVRSRIRNVNAQFGDFANARGCSALNLNFLLLAYYVPNVA